MSRYPRALLAHRRPGRRDFRFHSIEVEAGPLLHRRVLDGGRDELLHLLLDEYEAPEFVLEPLEVILRPGLRRAVRPAGALERIEAKIDQVRHVNVALRTQPTGGLIDEAILEVADAHGAQLTLPEVEDLVAIRRSLAGDHVHLVVAVEMHLVGAITELLAPLQLFADVGIAGCRHESREPIEPGDDAVLDLAGGHPVRPTGHRRGAGAALPDRSRWPGDLGLFALRSRAEL